MLKAVFQRAAPILIVCSLLASALGVVVATTGASADFPGTPDCDSNAIIRCGVKDLTELKSDYRANQGGNVKTIYAEFGIPNETALNGMVKGKVTKTGEVWVGSKKVATDAMTAGRENMPGSTPILNGQAFMRPPSVSFRSDSLEALVKMNGDTFQFAVIMSCGNPVKAKPVTPAPKPQPKPTPVATCNRLLVDKLPDRRVTASVEFTVPAGVEFKDVTFDWGDDTHTTTDNPFGVPHQFKEDKEFTIRASVNAMVNGQPKSFTGPGCVRTVKFEAQQPPQQPKVAKFEIAKDVRVKGQTEFQPEIVEAKAGDQVEFRITVRNTGETELTNVMLKDVLPVNSVTFTDTTVTGSMGVTGTISQLTSGGINLGTIAAGDSKEVQFTVTIGQNVDACETSLRNVANAKPDNLSAEENDARIKVCKPEQPVTPTTPEQPQAPQVLGKQTSETPQALVETGPGAVVGAAFTFTSALGVAAYKLKEFYVFLLRR